MKLLLILLICIFSYVSAEIARLSADKYGPTGGAGVACPNGLTGASCEMEANAEPSASDHQYTFLTILNYKTQMLPRASAPASTDNIAALADVSTNTGSRYIKSRVTLLEIGSQRYEACGVKYDTSDLANYAEFVPVSAEVANPYIPSTNAACPTGQKCHVLEMDTFLDGEATTSAQFIDIGSCTGGAQTTKAACETAQLVWATTGYACDFYVQNNMYLGSVKLAIAFQKTSTTTATGDSRLTKLHSSLKFVPSDDDPDFYTAFSKGFISVAGAHPSSGENGFQNKHMRDLAISYEDSCYSTAGYLRNDKFASGDCLDYTANNGVTANDNDVQVPIPSSSTAGTITLRLTGTFLDPRYKIISQSGVETLPPNIGNVLLIKEGLELHKDYRSFNDPSKDVRHNGGDETLQMTPVSFRLRKRSDATMMHCTALDGTASCPNNDGVDMSNAGQPLNGDAPQLQNYYSAVSNMGAATLDAADTAADYLCEVDDGVTDGTVYDISTAETTRGACHAQYVLNHDFVFRYGDLPDFKPGYIGCDICESVIAVKAFSEDILGTQKYQVNTRLAISVPDLPISDNSISIKTVNLIPRQPQFTLAPNVFYKMGELFQVVQSTSDLIDTGSNAPDDLDADLNFFNGLSGFLSFESFRPDGTAAVSDMELTSSACPTLSELKLHHLGSDTKEAVETLLISDCLLRVPTNFYGTDYKVKFKNTEAENTEHVVTIREIDARSIMIGSSQLNLINRVEAEILRVATTITMDISKTLPVSAIPAGYANSGAELSTQTISFRLKGDKGDFHGFISTTDGGRECAGDKIYWKSQTDRPYKLPSALAGSNVVYDTGGPWGICIGSSGLVVAPLETQPAAPITQVGKLLTYAACKTASGSWEITSIPDVTITCTVTGVCDDGNGEVGNGAAHADETTCNAATDCGTGSDTQCLYTANSLTSSDCALDKNDAQFGIHMSCTEAAKQEEVMFTSSPNNGEVKQHSIRSTDQCTGKLDFQLEDLTQYQEFAIYRTRIECSRVSTQELKDDVRLKYEFNTKLDLADNSLEITAAYTPTVNTAGKCQGDAEQTTEAACTLAGQAWVDEYAVTTNFGTCKNDNTIEAVANCAGVHFIDDEANNRMRLVKDSDDSDVTEGLQTLMNCHDTGNAIQVTHDGMTTPRQIPSDPAARNTIASYIITYDLAMIYERTLLNEAFDNAKIKYCDDQQFIATIRRDAKATTTVAQIKAASLNRAVVVSDIGWVGNEAGDYQGSDCTNPSEYQLEVIMKSMDQDARGDEGQWIPSELTKAFIDTASDALNDNNMKIHKPAGIGFGILKDTTPTVAPAANGGEAIDADAAVESGNFFKVRSECVVVTECVVDEDGVVDGDSWGDLTSLFKTDLVIRGTFLRSDVDSKIELTIDFDECPLDGEADVDGEIRVGLQLDCSSPEADQATDEEKLLAKSLAQIVANTHDESNTLTPDEYVTAGGKIDCSKAYADDVARVEGFIFATKAGCSDSQSNPNLLERASDGSEDYDSDCALLKDEYDAASAQQWSADIVDVFIDRFDTSGSVPLLTSSTRICKCESGNTDCEVDQTTIIGLDAFVQYTDAQSEFSQFQACGMHGIEANNNPNPADETDGVLGTRTGGDNKMKHQFGLMPMSAATSDLFKIRYEVILLTDLAPTRRRRLRTSFALRSGIASSVSSSNGFKVLEIASETAGSYDVPQGVVPVIANANATGTGDHDHDDDHDGSHEHNDISGAAIAGIVLGALAIIILIVLLITQTASKDPPKGRDGAALMEEEEESESDEEDEEFRSSKFRNLRY